MIRALFLAPLLAVSFSVFAAESGDPFTGGNADNGAKKAAVCAACHGPGGNSANPEWPNLAAQGAPYLYAQLKAFKSGQRKNALMSAQAANLSDEDMRDLAAYYSQQSAKPGVAAETAVKMVQGLYRGGDAERGIPACLACHGPAGKGNAAAGYPRIAGQQGAYVATQLKAYRAGERGEGVTGQMMQAVAQKLSDQEIEALASYVTGLQ